MATNRLLTINVGKNGLSSNIINEVKDIIKKYKRARIKFLQNCPDREDFKETMNKLLEETDTNLIKKRGFVLIIAKKP